MQGCCIGALGRKIGIWKHSTLKRQHSSQLTLPTTSPCFSPSQKLLQHPELSNSQLLADFLSPHSVESQFLDKMLPDVNLGTARACDRKLSDRLRVSARTRRTCCGNVGPTRPWAFEWKNVDDTDRGERK